MSNEPARELVENSVRRIPKGRVTTYGAIADEHGVSARQVARILATNEGDIPWHRVIKGNGELPKHGLKDRQRHLLETEGIALAGDSVIDFVSRFFST